MWRHRKPRCCWPHARTSGALRSTTCAVEPILERLCAVHQIRAGYAARRVRRCRRGTPSLARRDRHRLDTGLSDSELPASGTTRSYAEPELEAAAAAQWCAARLRADPAARLLIIVPRLGEQRHRWDRASRSAWITAHSSKEWVLQPMVARTRSKAASRYRTSRWRGRIGSAAARGGESDFASLSAVLCSSYLDPEGHAARLGLDVWLRNRILPCPTRDDCICCWTGPRTGRRAGGRRAASPARGAGSVSVGRAGGAEGGGARLGASLCGLAGLLRVAGHSARQ